jgi:hypothetical protein
MMDTEKTFEAFDLCSELIGLNIREVCDIKISLKNREPKRGFDVFGLSCKSNSS